MYRLLANACPSVARIFAHIYSLFRIRMQQINYKRTIQNYTHECTQQTYKHSRHTHRENKHIKLSTRLVNYTC